MNIHSVYGVFMRWYRPRRMKAMAQYFGMTEETNVLDVGGSMFNWSLLPFRPRLTILNLGPRPQHLPAEITYVQGDGLNLSFDENSFDLVFSNSVIEHVGGWDDQVRMANEIRRVGISYYVQTPNYWFPIEPHLITPIFHWLPTEAQRKLIRNFTVWGLLTRPPRESCERFLESIRLLTKREMAMLFTEAEWMNERVLGLEKSIIAVFRGRTPNP